jgi:hypothetical protein
MEKQRYGRAIIEYLSYCKKGRTCATAESAKLFLKDTTENDLRRVALRWFFTEGKKAMESGNQKAAGAMRAPSSVLVGEF